jgi:AcrR family transcriptional regulator
MSAAKGAETSGRPNQKSRTRKDLLQAAATLMKQGKKPSLEDVAEEAMVSRATAYRYFPNQDALIVEAGIHVKVPEAHELFDGVASDDPVARLELVDAALHDMLAENDGAMRVMLAQSLTADVSGAGSPRRQNRRTPLIEAALAPARDQFKPAELKKLSRALGVIIGTEAMVAMKDVLELDEAEARKVRHWAIRALVDAARK